jgi:hypothetical protein
MNAGALAVAGRLEDNLHKRIAALESALSEIRDMCAGLAPHDRIAGVAMIAMAGGNGRS